MKSEVNSLKASWNSGKRWSGITRPYKAEDVVKLRPSLKIEYTLASLGAEKLWSLLKNENYVHTFGALSGGQATQMVKAGLKSIYLSGW